MSEIASETAEERRKTFKLLKFPVVDQDEPVDDKPEIDPELVACLEQWLKDVKEGKFVAVGIVGVTPDGMIASETLNDHHNVHAVHSGLHLLARDILSDYTLDSGEDS